MDCSPTPFSFLKDVAAKKIPCSEDVLELLREMAKSNSSPDNAGFLAAQLLYRNGGQFLEGDIKNAVMVAGFLEVSKDVDYLLKNADLIPWNPSVIRSFLRGCTKYKWAPEEIVLRRVWIELHRFWHHHRLADSVRWSLRTLYHLFDISGHQSYVESFRYYLLNMQRLVKHRYLALALLIPKVSDVELARAVDILFYDLKECQKRQHLSSISAECVVVIGKRMSKDAAFYDFLLDVFLSAERQVRFSSLRYWIAQFAADKDFKVVLLTLMDRLRTAKPIEADKDTGNLTDIDFFWGLREHEVDPDAWDEDDRRLFALLVIIQAAMRCFGYQLGPEDDALVESCLKHRRSAVRNEALNLANDSSLEAFFLDNAATDDSQLREAMRKRMSRWTPSEEGRKKIQGWLEKDPNHQRITFVLDLAQKKGLKLPSETLKKLSQHADSDVRQKSISLLKSEEDYVDFLKSAFLENVANGEVIRTFVDALIDAGEGDFLKDHLQSLNKVLQISVESKLIQDLDAFLSSCEATMEENLVLSGSSRLGECSSMAELNTRMEIEKSLLISDKCSDNISSYAGILIECSKAMVDRVIGESLTYKLRVLKQIWTVLLRSRHKGVVDDCATQFERLRLKCSDKEVRGILEETLTLFGDENCSSRNLAFWRILLCFPKDVDTLIEKFIFHLNSKSDTVVIRSLKALKAVLGNSKYSADCEKFYSRILDFILQEYSKTSWAVRSAMNHTFEVLVHALFSRIPNNVPIFNFVFDYHQVWRVVVKALQSVRSDMDPQVVLVLSILERVLFVDELFFYDQELDTITIIREDLQRLRRSSKQIRIAQLLMDCHMNFTALSGWYEVGDKLKEMLSTCVTEGCGTSKAINHFCAVHAVRKISTEVRLPFSLPVDHYFEEQRKLGEHHPLNNLEIKDVAVFESLAVSAKELNRLCASFSLPYQWSLHPTSLSRRRNILPQAPRGGT